MKECDNNKLDTVGFSRQSNIDQSKGGGGRDGRRVGPWQTVGDDYAEAVVNDMEDDEQYHRIDLCKLLIARGSKFEQEQVRGKEHHHT